MSNAHLAAKVGSDSDPDRPVLGPVDSRPLPAPSPTPIQSTPGENGEKTADAQVDPQRQSSQSGDNGDAQQAQEGQPVIVESLRGCVVVFGCVLIALSCMGWGMVQGAFQEFYASTYYPETPESIISFIGGILAALCTGLAPIGGRLGDHYGYKPVIGTGLGICSFSLLISGFCTKVWHTFLAQAVLFGFGQCLVVPLILSLPSQWFGPHKALATGFVGGAAGFGGAIASILARLMLTHLPTPRFRNAMLIFFAIDTVVWSTGLWLVEERVQRKGSLRQDMRSLWRRLTRRDNTRGGLATATPEPGTPMSAMETLARAESKEAVPMATSEVPKSLPEQKPPPGFLQGLEKSSVFWCLSISVFVSTFAFLPPFQFITTYTRQFVDTSSSLTYAVPLAVMNASMGFGRLAAGQVADRLGPTQTLFLYLEIAGLLQIVAWHFAKSFGGICGFAAAYGFFGSSTLSLVPVVVMQLFGRTERLASVVGLIMQATAVGQLIGGFIAGKIYASTGGSWLAFQLFTGFVQIFGGLIMLWPWYRALGFPIPRFHHEV